MGVCGYADKNKLSNKIFSGESYSNLDKTIFLQKFYMDNIISEEEISPFFTSIIFEEILLEKNSKVKNRRFFKWYNMALGPYHNILSIQQKDNIINTLNKVRKNTLKKQKENDQNSTYLEIPNFTQDISVSEQGLRNYFYMKQIHFQSRIIKSPPACFRWVSWMIMSGVPISRPAIYYTNLLTYDLPPKVEEQIKKDLPRTLPRDENNYQEKVNSLNRLLRAMATIDKDLGYTQGMNFVVYHLLIASNRNEIDVFYLLMSIFSNTFSDKYGMRGFFIRDFPLLYTYTEIFEKKLKDFLPDVYQHIQKLNITPFSWISFWMQQIYTMVFPKEILLRIWDYFFVHGKKFLISLGISIISFFKENILKIKDNISFQDFFKLLNPNNKVNFKKDKYGSAEYDIEKILKLAIEKYYMNDEELDKEVKNKYPNYNTEYAYDYKSIESNPEVKSEYSIYAINSFKAWSCNNKNTISNQSTSSKFKESENQKSESKNKENLYKKEEEEKSENSDSDESENENKNKERKNVVKRGDSFSMDCIGEEIDDDTNFHSHIQDIKSKQNEIKKCMSRKK